MNSKKLFREILMKWHGEENKRSMPWKGEKDPYKVWLSEIILQQTRVEQGWDYYEKFISHYPTVNHLANAKDEAVFKLWEGLGYYTRCKNLLHTARFIQTAYAGRFPSSYDAILQLKGVGAYTASAVASFCFNLPHAVVDGNVLRILSRYFGIELPVDSTEGKKYFSQLAQDCLHTEAPGLYNQAIMDFGATVCKPLPACKQCPFNKKCVAYTTGKTAILPVKQKSIIKKERWFSYFIFSFNNKIWVQQRTIKDIWQNLHEFLLYETTANPEWTNEKIKLHVEKHFNISLPQTPHIIRAQKQVLTHQVINGFFIYVELTELPKHLPAAIGTWLNFDALQQKAFPQFINQFLQKNSLQLQVF